MEVHIEVCIMADDNTMVMKTFEGRDSIEKALEFLNALRLKVKA